jgi:hypothetical protein
LTLSDLWYGLNHFPRKFPQGVFRNAKIVIDLLNVLCYNGMVEKSLLKEVKEHG